MSSCGWLFSSSSRFCSKAAASSSEKNSFPARLDGLSKGVKVALVQKPCISGRPSGVFSALAAGPLPRRELTLTPGLGVASPRLGVAAGAGVFGFARVCGVWAPAGAVASTSTTSTKD